MVERGYRVVLTHGNGPQVGNALIRVEATRHIAPPLPLGVIVADLQGGMGYMIQQSLLNMLHRRGIQKEVMTLITQVVVRPDDPSIKNPTKFVGPIYPKEKVQELQHLHGWILKEDRGRGWRRVVPSPEPVEIVEKNVIKELVANGRLVIAAGGGGIPVYLDREERLEGINAVIDKDLAAAILARDIGADELVILTGVEKVALDFARPTQRWLDHMTVAEAQKYLAEGQFPEGSMGPKIRGAINFLESGGKRVTITSIEMLAEAMQGKTGTVIQ
jgi:carbamate kinase